MCWDLMTGKLAGNLTYSVACCGEFIGLHFWRNLAMVNLQNSVRCMMTPLMGTV